MIGKKGTAGEWIFVIVLMLVVGGVSVYISYTLVSNAKADIKAEGYSKCELVELTNGPKDDSYKSEYSSKTPRQICSGLNKQVKFVSSRYAYGIYHGDTAESCDSYRKNDLSFDIEKYMIAGEEAFDTALVQESNGPCRSGGGSTSVGSERTIYMSALCC